MEKQFVRDLAPNAKVNSPFAVKDKALAPFKSKPGKFLNVTLCDRTGDIKARVWDNAEEVAGTFSVGDVVTIKGRAEEYRGQLQIIISGIAQAEADSYDPDDLVARAGKSREELLAWLDEAVAEVTDVHLRALLDAFMSDEAFRERFADARGARSLHHAYVGGLLEHTLSVAEILKAVAELHPELNRDLLITGAILHDIGKMEELGGAITVDYTDLGRFVGHTVLGDRMVAEKVAQIEEFPPHLANLLSHMLLSHHGEREWGAPVVPATMEACALHYADNLDARVQGFKQVIEAGAGSGASWSDYHRSYQRAIYLGPPPEPTDDDDEEETDGQLRL